MSAAAEALRELEGCHFEIRTRVLVLRPNREPEVFLETTTPARLDVESMPGWACFIGGRLELEFGADHIGYDVTFEHTVFSDGSAQLSPPFCTPPTTIAEHVWCERRVAFLL